MIEVNNLTGTYINKELLIEVAKKVLKREDRKMAELSIAIVGEAKMRELNKKYRQKDKATDVLSFQYGNHKTGEVAICLKEVKKNAKKFKSTLNKELARVLIHGILHILGYNHKGMVKKESYYLLQIK